MSRLSKLNDRAAARTESVAGSANLAALRGHASDAAEAIGPRVQHARELAEPYVHNARERIEPYVSTARDRVDPYLSTARDRVEPYVSTARERLTPVAEQAIASGRDIATTKLKPAYDQAVATSRDTVAPAVSAALANAATNTAPARKEAKVRGTAALAALRGDVPARPSRRWPLVAGVLVLGAIIGAAASEVARRAGGRGLSVAPTPLRPNTVIIPDTIASKHDHDHADGHAHDDEPVGSEDPTD